MKFLEAIILEIEKRSVRIRKAILEGYIKAGIIRDQDVISGINTFLKNLGEEKEKRP